MVNTEEKHVDMKQNVQLKSSRSKSYNVKANEEIVNESKDLQSVKAELQSQQKEINM